jgi:hypothetical protein
MRATITMPLETLKAIIERAREFEFVDDDEDFADDEEEDEDAESDVELSDDEDTGAVAMTNGAASDELEADDDGLEADDEAFEEILESLTSEELSELLALSWLGEGDYDRDNWDGAVSAARALSIDDVIVQLAENPVVADSIERGLVALGYEITED